MDPHDDPTRVQQITRLDRAAHEHEQIARGWEGLAKLKGQVADLLDELGETAAAQLARHDEEDELLIAENEERRTVGLLLQERILQGIEPSEQGIAKLRAGLADIRAALGVLVKVVQSNVPAGNEKRKEVERLYKQLQTQLDQPVNDRRTAAATLDNLERCLRAILEIASADEGVRRAWVEQAGLLAALI